MSYISATAAADNSVYGNAMDGNVTLSSNTVLDVSKAYGTLQLSSNMKLSTAQAIISCATSCTIDSGSGITTHTAAGTAGQGTVGTGFVKDTNATDSWGGAGGDGGDNASSGGTATRPNSKSRDLIEVLPWAKMGYVPDPGTDISGILVNGGAGGGTGGYSGYASDAGDGGRGGGVFILASPTITVTAPSGYLNQDGFDGTAANAGNAGGGGGGGGGLLIIITKAAVSGNAPTVDGGAGGAGNGSGSAGAAGSAGRIITILH